MEAGRVGRWVARVRGNNENLMRGSDGNVGSFNLSAALRIERKGLRLIPAQARTMEGELARLDV